MCCAGKDNPRHLPESSRPFLPPFSVNGMLRNYYQYIAGSVNVLNRRKGVKALKDRG
jgi:hypothetical protein